MSQVTHRAVTYLWFLEYEATRGICTPGPILVYCKVTPPFIHVGEERHCEHQVSNTYGKNTTQCPS